MTKAALYRFIWRLHMWAGLFVIPFILILSITGSIFLFKPQLDKWQESDWRGLSVTQAVSPDAQLATAMAAVPGATFHSYRLPQAKDDAAVIHVGLAGGKEVRDIYVAPSGQLLAIVDPEAMISATVRRFHGTLLMGKFGSTLVEIAATLAIMMILSGLFLWWPRSTGASRPSSGRFWPRLKGGARQFWRDLHAVTGFWVAGLALLLLFSGLPWTDNWGSVIKSVRSEMGWVDSKPQDWQGGDDAPAVQHQGHDHQAMLDAQQQSGPVPAPENAMTLGDIVHLAGKEDMAFPALVQPPGAPSRFGPPNGDVWKLTSEAQNRPLIRNILYDPQSGAVVSRTGFADKHIADRIINYGIAWHEGQLFGWINQLVGLLTALALITIAVSGTRMWWKKRPSRAAKGGA
ncbi:PepSY-associated TM helix domain-containing protein [Parasphingorhabdus sp.]|uniref:PepSY-associated TM helix domain-containing protein n=1 Tax=Parasphingorhabdus sp. TaxID=2709688 RepID=UPI003A8F01D7